MILLVYYHPVISATWNCQLSRKRGITFSVVSDYINKGRFSSLPIPSCLQQLFSSWNVPGSTEGEKQKQPSHSQVSPASGSGEGPKADREGQGEGSSVESPGAVGRSHACGARQQTQFTKRHLFHYSNALWLITSWPVCEMTATYSPVNRKICTCSIWGAGCGGWSGRPGEQPRGKRKGRRKPKK